MNLQEIVEQVGGVFDVLALGRHDGVLFTRAELEELVALVAAHEREECIKAIKKLLSEVEGQPIPSLATKEFVVQVAHFVSEPMIEAIRARGTR